MKIIELQSHCQVKIWGDQKDSSVFDSYVNVIWYNITHHCTGHICVNVLVAKFKKMNWFSTSMSVCQHKSTLTLSSLEIISWNLYYEFIQAYSKMFVGFNELTLCFAKQSAKCLSTVIHVNSVTN